MRLHAAEAEHGGEDRAAGTTYRCRACGAAGREAFRKRGFVIAACRVCGSDFVADPLPSVTAYDETYFDARGVDGYPDYVQDRDLILANFLRRARWLEPLAEGPRLLDVGTAYGLFLVAARARGFDALGIEPVAECARYARSELGVQVLPGLLEEIDLEPASFDVVTLLDVIEHLADPAGALRRIRPWLKPGGLLVVETGDRDALLARVLGRRWYFYDPPQHLTFFSRASLTALLEGCGFSPPLSIGHLGRKVSLRNVSFQLGRALGTGALAGLCRGVSRSPLGRLRFRVPDRGNAFILAARAGA